MSICATQLYERILVRGNAQPVDRIERAQGPTIVRAGVSSPTVTKDQMQLHKLLNRGP